MRTTHIVLASLLLTGLALVPAATAIKDPFVVCVTEPCGPQAPDGVYCAPTDKQTSYGVRIVRDADCNHRVDVKFMDCVWNGSWKSYGTEPLVVRVYTCDGNPPDATASSAFRCPHAYVETPEDDLLGTSSYEMEHTCWSNVVLNEGLDCPDGTQRNEVPMDGMYVVYHTCMRK